MKEEQLMDALMAHLSQPVKGESNNVKPQAEPAKPFMERIPNATPELIQARTRAMDSINSRGFPTYPIRSVLSYRDNNQRCAKCGLFHTGVGCGGMNGPFGPLRENVDTPNTLSNVLRTGNGGGVGTSDNGRGGGQGGVHGRGNGGGNGGGSSTWPGRLSLACQARGFNPKFTVTDRGGLYGVVTLGGAVTLRTEKCFENAVAAKDCVAKMGLDYLKLNPGFRPSSTAVSFASRTPVSQPPSARREAPAQGISPCLPIRPAAERFSTGHETKLSNARSSIDLPGNIEPSAVRGIVERAIAGGGITFNLPGNVSTQVAEAYGRAFGELSRTHRSLSSRARTRSRSPPREPRHERSRRERERDDQRRRRPDCYRPS